jgi:hypothetical protein
MQPALVISVLALLFTVFSFWWMNWRRGRLHVGEPRSYAAFGSNEGKLVIEIPLIFFNSGPIPRIVRNLRLVPLSGDVNDPLVFTATVEKLGTDEGRTFATQIPVRGREAQLLICEFQRSPGQLVFEEGAYPFSLQAQLDKKDKWKDLLIFNLNVSAQSAESINRQFIVHDNLVAARTS